MFKYDVFAYAKIKINYNNIFYDEVPIIIFVHFKTIN